jgi:RNA 3'-terminal phosphate cyclase
MGIGDIFLKFSDAIRHGEAFAAQIIAFADKGMAIDQHLLDKARGYSAMAKHVIPGLEQGPATMTVAIPAEHAAALGVK